MSKHLVGNIKGDSAYQVAVKNGFVGTEQEWLDSLVAGGEGGAKPREVTIELPESLWVVAHKLGRRPVSVVTYDHNDIVIYGDVISTTEQISVSFPEPTRGILAFI